jgi:hypothetical protein
MAAFCGCCGAEITTKAEKCPVCGTPRHGMSPETLAAGVLEPAASPNPDQPDNCSWVRC